MWYLKSSLQIQDHLDFSPVLSSKIFMHFRYRPVIYFVFIFVKNVKSLSSFFFFFFFGM